MEKNNVEMVDKIQLLTRAMSISEKATVNLATGYAVKEYQSVDNVIENYKKLYAVLTEEPQKQSE